MNWIAVNSKERRNSLEMEMNVHYIHNTTLMIRNGFSRVTVNAEVLLGAMFGINMVS